MNIFKNVGCIIKRVLKEIDRDQDNGPITVTQRTATSSGTVDKSTVATLERIDRILKQNMEMLEQTRRAVTEIKELQAGTKKILTETKKIQADAQKIQTGTKRSLFLAVIAIFAAYAVFIAGANLPVDLAMLAYSVLLIVLLIFGYVLHRLIPTTQKNE